MGTAGARALTNPNPNPNPNPNANPNANPNPNRSPNRSPNPNPNPKLNQPPEDAFTDEEDEEAAPAPAKDALAGAG